MQNVSFRREFLQTADGAVYGSGGCEKGSGLYLQPKEEILCDSLAGKKSRDSGGVGHDRLTADFSFGLADGVWFRQPHGCLPRTQNHIGHGQGRGGFILR